MYNKTVMNHESKVVLYHGSRKEFQGNIAPISRSTCDFGKGFYLGTEPLQALTLISDEEKPVLYTIQLDLTDLKVLDVKMNLEWAMLIAYYRGYLEDVKGTAFYNKYEKMADDYDVIFGVSADGRMYRVMKNFFDKEITDEALLHSLSVLDLGHQYVCKTSKACESIEIIDQKVLTHSELLKLRLESLQKREEGIAHINEVLLKYRRDGYFFDEIVKERVNEQKS